MVEKAGLSLQQSQITHVECCVGKTHDMNSKTNEVVLICHLHCRGPGGQVLKERYEREEKKGRCFEVKIGQGRFNGCI